MSQKRESKQLYRPSIRREGIATRSKSFKDELPLFGKVKVTKDENIG